MGAFAVPLMVASAAVSAVGAIKSAQAQAASYKAQANAQQYQATVDRNNAQMALEQANAKEESQLRKFGALQGQAFAGIAQSGTGFDGSNVDVLHQNEIANRLDELTIRYEGQTQSKSLLAQADIDQYNSEANRANAGRAMTAGYINAGANLLSGASKLSANSYYNQTGKLPVWS